MRIAFDATGILGPNSKNRGIGNYSTGQFAAMVKQDTENEYFFFNLFEEDFLFRENIAESKNLKEVSLYAGKDIFLLKDLSHNIVKKIIQKFLEQNDIDIFYFTSPFDGNMQYRAEWFEGVKTVALVYDIIPYIFKERYFPDGAGLDWYMECIGFLRAVDRIQVISQSVKDDLVKYLQFPADKIDVIWGAVDKRYQEIEISEEEKQELFDKFGVKDQFIMCTGGDDERKNIAGLIEAYSKMQAAIKEQYQLVIVCKLSVQAVEKYEELCRNLGCEGRVVLTNFVTNKELLQFYNLASLMAFPSVYEGFGLPVVEAWACGTPVLTSDNSSLVQIAGEGAVLVDPFDTEAITRGLEYALTECDLDVLLEKGKEQLKKFQWEKVAKLSLDSINRLGISQKELETIDKKEKKKLAFFIPLPLLRAEASGYYVKLISELAKEYDVDVFVDDEYESDINWEESVHIMKHEIYKSRLEKYFATIYRFGNADAYLYMIPYIRNYPGIIDLNHYNLNELAINLCFSNNRQNYDMFAKLLLHDYSWEIVDKYVSGLKNGSCEYQTDSMPLNGFITDYSNRIIVHDNEVKKLFLEKNISKDIGYIRYSDGTETDGYEKEKWDLSAAAREYVDFIEKRSLPYIEEADIKYVSERLSSIGVDEEELDKMSETLTYLM